MEILGYIAFAALIFLTITWTIGVRTQLDAGTGTVIGALFFLSSTLTLFISGADKTHALWLVPTGFVIPFVVAFIGNTSLALLFPFRVIAGVFASVLRVGIPAEKVKAAQEEGLRTTVKEWSEQRRRKDQADDKIAIAHRYLLAVIRLIKTSLSACGIDMHGEKTLLVQGLFYMGFVDALQQAINMTETEFLQLHKKVFSDLGFGSAFTAKVLLFHQAGQIDHPAFKAILAGGNFFRKLSSGDKAVESMLAGNTIAELARDSSIPSSAALL